MLQQNPELKTSKLSAENIQKAAITALQSGGNYKRVSDVLENLSKIGELTTPPVKSTLGITSSGLDKGPGYTIVGYNAAKNEAPYIIVHQFTSEAFGAVQKMMELAKRARQPLLVQLPTEGFDTPQASAIRRAIYTLARDTRVQMAEGRGWEGVHDRLQIVTQGRRPSILSSPFVQIRATVKAWKSAPQQPALRIDEFNEQTAPIANQLSKLSRLQQQLEEAKKTTDQKRFATLKRRPARLKDRFGRNRHRSTLSRT